MKTHDYGIYADNYTQFKAEDTIYLIYNDLEKMLKKHGRGTIALDYGCGTGDGITVLHWLERILVF